MRHVVHVAKAAASVDQLSGGRFCSASRPATAGEFAAFGRSHDRRGEAFREAVAVLHRLWSENAPVIESPLVHLQGEDVVPKPLACRVPLLVTGCSIAVHRHGHGLVADRIVEVKEAA